MSLRPTFMGINTASRAMMNGQKAIDIVGNNLANIDTTGYTRQRVDLVSMGVSYAKTRYTCKTSLAGNGANISGVSQIRDPFLDKRFREQYADTGYYNGTSQILTDVQAALDEIEPASLTTALKNFQASFSASAKDGNDPVDASGLRSAANTLTQVLRQMYSQLDDTWENTKYDLNTNVTHVNSLLESIADYNVKIAQECRSATYAGSEYYMPNELLDQRNVLLDQLSEYGNINVKQVADGTVTVTMAGKTVVQADQYESILLAQGASDNTVELQWLSNAEPLKLTTGSLKASQDMLNGRGNDAKIDLGESTERGILYYKDKIDKFATTMADAFNHLIPVVGEDANGNKVYKDPMEYKTMFSFGEKGEASAYSAGNIRVNPEWEKDASYIITDIYLEGEDDMDFTALATELFSRQLDFGEFKGSMNDYIIFYSTTNLGAQVENAGDRLKSCTSICDELLDQIYDVSGVSFDEEGANMIQYKKAYDAVSRLMTTMDDMLDKLINGTGRVGL